ncbi:MAG TPA: carboxypeptidase-like regulatory domain-containing protein [Pyrinomonadaceae bacterium]|jgi:hypothetical protein|nr:carboxypeptidase-like regulatory domain-containing protein [Pyrinomonadaceae bacterium]
MAFLRVGLLLVALPLSVMAQGGDTSKLTGTVYDAQGAVIVGAKVTAISANGKKYQTTTKDDGVYVLELPFRKYDASRNFTESKYDLIVESPGFRRSETKEYVFIPSQFGKMMLDIALGVGILNDPSHP